MVSNILFCGTLQTIGSLWWQISHSESIMSTAAATATSASETATESTQTPLRAPREQQAGGTDGDGSNAPTPASEAIPITPGGRPGATAGKGQRSPSNIAPLDLSHSIEVAEGELAALLAQGQGQTGAGGQHASLHTPHHMGGDEGSRRERVRGGTLCETPHEIRRDGAGATFGGTTGGTVVEE